MIVLYKTTVSCGKYFTSIRKVVIKPTKNARAYARKWGHTPGFHVEVFGYRAGTTPSKKLSFKQYREFWHGDLASPHSVNKKEGSHA